MRYSELQRHITALKKTIAQLQAEGDVMQDCWFDSAQRKGSGTRDGQERYTRLRWMQDGKKRCRTLAPTEVATVRAAIERSEQLHQLQQQLEERMAELNSINALADELGLNVPKKLLMHSSESNEWYTPAEWVDRARRVMGSIDLDPASNLEAQTWIRARRYYTQDDDGLKQCWRGRVWLNPPYGQRNLKQGVYGASAWILKAIDEYDSGNIKQAVLWLRASGNAGIKALDGRFPRVVLGRVNHAPAGAAGLPQKGVGHDTVVYYLGDRMERFQKIFRTAEQ